MIKFFNDIVILFFILNWVKNKMVVLLGNFVKGNNFVKVLKDYFKNIFFKMFLEMLIWLVWFKIIEGIFKKN